ncbi:hypothetical protein Misp04_31020 [Micromonospora sp. NBRC 101691]|nr:hypothetical protein Misp04_31020 [Micromonospora sp. NBRC 101691]
MPDADGQVVGSRKSGYAFLPDHPVLTCTLVVGTLSPCARPARATRACAGSDDPVVGQQHHRATTPGKRATVRQGHTRCGARVGTGNRELSDTPDRGCRDLREVALVGM